MPTHGYGDIFTIGNPNIKLQVIGADGEPASGVSILARDRYATLHLIRWHKTDQKGAASIELVDDPTIVVINWGDKLQTIELPRNRSNPVIKIMKK